MKRAENQVRSSHDLLLYSIKDILYSEEKICISDKLFRMKCFFSEKKSGVLTNIVDSVSTTNQQNLSTVKNVDLRKSHPHQQNWSIVQIVDSLLDPNQQSVSLKIGETTKCTLGFYLHNNKFVDQQSGSNVQIVVSGPTSTNCVIPNLPRGSRQLYPQ